VGFFKQAGRDFRAIDARRAIKEKLGINMEAEIE
jgi:hypothetical protein